MFSFYQKLYGLIFNSIQKYSEKLSVKIKKACILISFVCIICVYILNCDIYNFSFRSRNIIYAISFAVLLIFVTKNNGNKILYKKEDKLVLICLYILGIGSIIAGGVNGVAGYFFYGIVYLFLLPAGTIAFNNANLNEVILPFSKCSVLLFLVISICSFLFKPIVETQYASVFGDPNLLGLFCVETIISGIYLIKSKNGGKIVYIAVFLAISFCYISGSRTSTFAVLCIITIEAIYWIKSKKISFVKILKVIIGIAATVYITMFILLNITPGLADLERSLYKGEKISISEMFDYDITFYFNDTTDNIIDKNLKGIKNNDNFTAGRTDIWKESIHSLNCFGHDTELVKGVTYFNKPMYVHNGILQIWYSMGIIPTIGFISIMLFAGISALKLLCRFTNWTNESLFAIEVIGSISIFVMLFSMYFIFTNPLIYMYYIILFSLKSDCSVNMSKKKGYL